MVALLPLKRVALPEKGEMAELLQFLLEGHLGKDEMGELSPYRKAIRQEKAVTAELLRFH